MGSFLHKEHSHHTDREKRYEGKSFVDISAFDGHSGQFHLIDDLNLAHVEVAEGVILSAGIGMSFEVFLIGGIDTKVGIAVCIGGKLDFTPNVIFLFS